MLHLSNITQIKSKTINYNYEYLFQYQQVKSFICCKTAANSFEKIGFRKSFSQLAFQNGSFVPALIHSATSVLLMLSAQLIPLFLKSVEKVHCFQGNFTIIFATAKTNFISIKRVDRTPIHYWIIRIFRHWCISNNLVFSIKKPIVHYICRRATLESLQIFNTHVWIFCNDMIDRNTKCFPHKNIPKISSTLHKLLYINKIRP